MAMRMKKHAGWIARLLVAIAGISFIALTLTWHDQVVLPAGYRLVGGTTLAEQATVPVIKKNKTQLHVDTRGFGDYSETAIDRDALGTAAGQPRFQPGVLTTLTRTNWALVLAALVVMGVVFPLQTWRWLGLMRCRGMDVSFIRALRLTMAGLFFNFCMPGTTGGDLVKAYYTAKNSGQRTTAVISVLLDRVAGLVGLVLLAAIVGLTLWRAEPWLGRLTLALWGGLLALVLISLAYVSSGWRQAMRLDRLRAILPGGTALARIDEAATAYRHHKPAVGAAVGVSVVVHLCLMTAAALTGKAMGIDHSFGVLVAVLPLVFLAGSLPITYQGLGVMEWLVLVLLQQPELATANQLVGMLLLFRLCMLLYGLLGSLVLLRGDIHLFPETAAQPTLAKVYPVDPAAQANASPQAVRR
jgi:uncharacterized protein (TIRG00374 family)